MTMPCERTRSIVQTGEFLRELSRDQTLPECSSAGKTPPAALPRTMGDLWDRLLRRAASNKGSERSNARVRDSGPHSPVELQH